MIGFAILCSTLLASAPPPPAPSLFSGYTLGPAGSPHPWMTVDQATINFDLVKAAPEKMTLRLSGSLVEIDLAHFIQRTGYETDDEGGPVIPDPDASPEDMAFYWHGTGRGQTLHLTWHKGGVFGTSYGPIGSFLIEPSAAGPFAVQIRAVNPEAWTQHHLPPDESTPDDMALLRKRSLWAASSSTGPTDQQPPTAGPPIARPRLDQKDGRGSNSCVQQPINLGTWDPSCTLEPLGSGSQLDILVLYTPAALAEVAKESPNDPVIAMRARIENEVNVTNTIFRESAIEGVELYLKGIAPTPGGRNDDTPTGSDYEKSVQQMQWLNGAGDPEGTIPRRPATGNPAVQALREAHEADIVGMVQADFYGACGAAVQTRMHYNQGRDFEPEVGAGTAQRLAEPGPSYFYASGFIVDMDCSAARWDFAHEVLHILGVQHDPASDPEGYSPWSDIRASCPDAFGWRQRGTYHNNNKDDDADEYRRHRHRDLMAYPSSFHGGTGGLPGICYPRPDLPGPPFYGWNCPRVDRLSNRDLEWNGYEDVHGNDPGPDDFGVNPFGTFQPPPPGNRHRIGSEPGQPDAWRGGDARFAAMRVSRLVAQYCSRPDLGFADGFEAQP